MTIDTSECQPHVGWFHTNGYGYVQVKCEGSRRTILAHRLAWALHNGADPEGKVVMHSCDNRACVNPTHLVLGTQSENILDMYRKRRGANGSSNGKMKLTKLDVDAIKELLSAGIRQRRISDEYGIAQSVVSDINIGKRSQS